MHRIIKIGTTSYTANVGALENHRITIKAGEVSVSADLDTTMPEAEFEAVFYGRERINMITTPAPVAEIVNVPNPDYDPESNPDVPATIEETRYIEQYEIGPLELDADETPLVLAKRAKLSEIAAARWNTEVGGVVVNGLTIDTSRESQGMITGAALTATLDEAYTCQWKTATGFVVLTAEQIIAVAQAVREHVQTCFDREAELTDEVNAAETIAAVEAISW
jgi:hypothetical protein